MSALNVTMDEMMTEAKMSEEKAQRVMMDAARYETETFRIMT